MPNISIYRGNSHKTSYIILPEGLTGESLGWIENNAKETGITTIVITGINWNDNLTPWEAEGVFKKAKPFGGKADFFLKELVEEIIPNTEKELQLEITERSIVGVSLSGLFALWAIHMCDAFSSAIIISGSFWYDNLSEWVESHNLSPGITDVYIALGDREKNSKNPRMAKVEEETNRIVQLINNESINLTYELFDGTHFSPILPRLINGFKTIYK